MRVRVYLGRPSDKVVQKPLPWQFVSQPEVGAIEIAVVVVPVHRLEREPPPVVLLTPQPEVTGGVVGALWVGEFKPVFLEGAGDKILAIGHVEVGNFLPFLARQANRLAAGQELR